MTSRKFFTFLDPLPPLCHAFTQPISTVCPQNWAILEPPSPPRAWRHLWMVPNSHGLHIQPVAIPALVTDFAQFWEVWALAPQSATHTSGSVIHPVVLLHSLSWGLRRRERRAAEQPNLISLMTLQPTEWGTLTLLSRTQTIEKHNNTVNPSSLIRGRISEMF